MTTAAQTADNTATAAMRHMGGPAPTSIRIEALDFVRGAALFGILLMNITAMGLPHAYSNPTVAGGAEGVNLWTWIVTTIGFEGTQRALFSLLFGAGVILFSTRLEAAGRRDAADIYFRRNLWLVAFGCVNSFLLLWTGDILYYYGITALFLYAFRNLPPKRLLVLGLVVLALNAAWNAKDALNALEAHSAYVEASRSATSGNALSLEQKEAIASWEEMQAGHHPSAQKLEKEAESMRAGYASAFMLKAAENVKYQSWWLYRYFADIFGIMMIGMALFKFGILTIERPARIYVLMMVVGYAIGLTVNTLEVRWILENDFSLLAYAQTNITYDAGRLAMTMGHLGALLLFVRSGLLPWFRHALASVGRMAFTNYISHSILALILFVGFGLFGQLERHQLYLIVFTVWAAQLVVSPMWLKHYRFGPLEWLWRYLTYGTRPRFRKAVPQTPVPALVSAE
jgi:uncharacterized protein